MIHTRIADRYILLAPIGSGGEARVFRARDESDGNEVAVRLAIDPEAKAGAPPPDFTHPRWVQLLDAGTDPQHGLYQVFELLEGRTLGAVVEEGPLPRAGWRAFADQSLEAVEALHVVGAVHGDINADNFLQVTSGWKLLELPFSRLRPPTGRSTMFGSIYTLAPEQIDGAKPSAASDLYALGCLYYYAAAGTWPHTGGSVQQIAISCLTQVPTNLRELAANLPAAWCEWVMGFLAKKPGDRFPSVAAARRLLADAVA
jgi:serine/threonine protein kinase